MPEDPNVASLGEKIDALGTHITGLHEKIDTIQGVTAEHGKRMDAMSSEFDSMRKRADAAAEDEEERKDAAEEEREEEEREDARRKADAKHRADGESEEARKERKEAEEREDAKRRADARERRDAKRKDESKERRDARHAREDARHSARMDARHRKDEAEEKERMDAKAKKDAEEAARADAAGAAHAAELAAVRAELALLKGRLPAQLNDQDKLLFVAAQTFADSAYQTVFSEQAPYAQNGESLEDYRVRLMTKLKPSSRSYKDSNLSILVKDASFHEIEKIIVAEAIDASRSNLQLGAPLRKEVKRLPTGHTETKYYGDSAVTWAPFSGGGVQFVKFNRALADAAAARDSARR